VKLSFVLFDEIEKASDALWNLLLGILDKATLTLGDNRRVDFSACLIFLTSNLGASEMSSILSPRLGFGLGMRTSEPDEAQTAEKIQRTGVAAARRKFTAEFMNRLDKVVVFQPLGEADMRRILDLELSFVQDRVLRAGAGRRPFAIQVAPEAKERLLGEGADRRYGARHLKRAIERLLVQPLSNLIATNQVRAGDCVRVENGEGGLKFRRDPDPLTAQELAELAAARPASGLYEFAHAAGNTATRNSSRGSLLRSS
jgi:ATP-dependent Clp protease ATP-binding subunit ClpA